MFDILSLIEYFVSLGVDNNAKDGDELTALHMAISLTLFTGL